jgi:undecaprenyl-diphosphatase
LLDLDRWARDDSAPRRSQALRDAASRLLAPAVALFAAIVGIGYMIEGPLHGWTGEEAVNRALQQGRTRTPWWDTMTGFWSMLGNTEYVIAVCVVMVAVTLWRTRQWWYAIVPAIAISLQATVFVLATTIVGRDRPHVDHLDPAPPTSSYPSGHVGAATALYLTFAFMAPRIERTWLQRVVTAACLLVPLLVSYARVYRGMHHLSDVMVGMANGVVCALLAWRWLRRSHTTASRARTNE